MGFIELLGIGVSLSMDAFAVAVCKGLGMKKINYREALIIALMFGGFQALMPFIGWLLGSQFEKYIIKYDHWITFVLLGVIGGKMIYDAIFDKEKDACPRGGRFDIREIILLAVATSIDALAVGISFAFNQVRIGGAISIIGVTTLIICMAGVVLGNRFGSRFRNKATFAGGLILILIGTKILLEHLGII